MRPPITAMLHAGMLQWVRKFLTREPRTLADVPEAAASLRTANVLSVACRRHGLPSASDSGELQLPAGSRNACYCCWPQLTELTTS